MKPIQFILVAVSLVAVSCSHGSKNESGLTFLHAEGHYMVNEKGDTILLKGVGLGNWLLPEGYMWRFGGQGDRPRKIEKIIEDLTSAEYAANFWKEFRLNFVTEADIKKMKELGFNSVRPALNARIFLTEGDTAVFIEENFVLLDNLIDWCGKYGLYVILDMHGAPGGQTGQNIDDSPNDEPELFMNPIYEQRLTRLWIKLAERYKHNPVVAGYDLLNEPLPERTGAAGEYGHMMEPMYKRLTEEIRKIDKKHMIILEGINWANDWSIFTEKFDDNMVYQFHYYCWSNPDNLNDISHYISERERLNAPVWVGETGERNPAIYYATTQYFEKNNIGWSYWTWKKTDSPQVVYSIPAPEGYNKIIRYSRTGEKPPRDSAEMIFTALLENMKIENCEFREDVVQALFRRLPSRVFAVNYGHDGQGISYQTNDTLGAEYYRRNEPVKTGLIRQERRENEQRRRRGPSQQYVSLSEGEWTAYPVFSESDFEGSITVRAKGEVGAEVFIGMNSYGSAFTFSDTTWTDLLLEGAGITVGKNNLQAETKKGIVHLLYFDIE